MLDGKRIAIFAEKDFEDLELFYPYLRLIEAGADVKILGVRKEKISGKHGLTINVDLLISEADPNSFDCLIIPGGWAPDRLRRYSDVLDFTRRMFSLNKIVATICHGPQVAISAGILKGRRLTCVSAIKDDVINAGATYVDVPVIRDGNLISSRVPSDLPQFCQEIINALK